MGEAIPASTSAPHRAPSYNRLDVPTPGSLVVPGHADLCYEATMNRDDILARLRANETPCAPAA
jgi:hypothetical protein